MSDTKISEAWPEYMMIRDTQLNDDAGGLGQRIFTTAGSGYEKVKYIRADLAHLHPQPAELADTDVLEIVARYVGKTSSAFRYIKEDLTTRYAAALDDALAATGKQQVSEVQGDALTAVVEAICYDEHGIQVANVSPVVHDRIRRALAASQPVHLGEFREPVQYWLHAIAGYAEASTVFGPAACAAYAAKAEQAKRLLALIDGQAVAKKASDSIGHCANKKQPGGCHLSNLQCGYPACDKQSYGKAVQ